MVCLSGYSLWEEVILLVGVGAILTYFFYSYIAKFPTDPLNPGILMFSVDLLLILFSECYLSPMGPLLYWVTVDLSVLCIWLLWISD